LQQDKIMLAPKVRGHLHKDFPIEPFLVETDSAAIFHVLEKLERNRVDGALRLARSGAPGNEPAAAHKIVYRPRQPAEPENNSAANTADGRWPKPVGEESADRRSDELAETRLAVPTVKKKEKAASLVLLRIRKVTIAGLATRPSPTRTRCSKT
jgi:hypothetical protein